MFLKNLEIAIANDDNGSIRRLLYEQVADLALNQPDKLYASIKNAGISVSENLSPAYLVEVVIDNWNNKKMIQGIANLIAVSNKPDGNYLYAGETIWGGIVRAVGGIVRGFGKVATAVTVTKVEKEKQKGAMFEILSAQQAEKAATLQREIEAKTREEKYKNQKLVTTSIIGLVVLAVIGVLVYKNS